MRWGRRKCRFEGRRKEAREGKSIYRENIPKYLYSYYSCTTTATTTTNNTNNNALTAATITKGVVVPGGEWSIGIGVDLVVA